MQPTKMLDAPLPYLLYTPDTATDVPMILFLHGAGERGDDLEKVKTHGLPNVLEAHNPFPEPALVVAPQCPADSWWTLELNALESLLDAVQAQHQIDPARVYLTGLSMGGYGAWHLAIKDPERFSALVPVCGGGVPALAAKLKNLPTWAFHGANDDVVPLSASTKMVEALKEAGGHAKLTVYPNVGHNSWSRAYSESNLYAWLFAQRQGEPEL